MLSPINAVAMPVASMEVSASAPPHAFAISACNSLDGMRKSGFRVKSAVTVSWSLMTA